DWVGDAPTVNLVVEWSAGVAFGDDLLHFHRVGARGEEDLAAAAGAARGRQDVDDVASRIPNGHDDPRRPIARRRQGEGEGLRLADRHLCRLSLSVRRAVSTQVRGRGARREVDGDVERRGRFDLDEVHRSGGDVLRLNDGGARNVGQDSRGDLVAVQI